MTINTQWIEIKKFICDNTLTLEWIVVSNTYYLSAHSKSLEITASILISDPPSEEQADFEKNYKK